MALRHVLLTVLQQHEATGYEIIRDFDHALGFFWHASHQQVYRELGRLTREGLVDYQAIEQRSRPDKKRYRITDQGRQALIEWLATPAAPRRFNDELLVKILGGELLGAERLLKEIEHHRGIQEDRLSTFLAIEAEHYRNRNLPELSMEYRLLYLPLRKGIKTTRAWLDWADEARTLLKDGKIV